MPFTLKTIYSQIIVLIVLAIIIVITIVPAIESWLQVDDGRPDIEQLADRLYAMSVVVAAATPEERETIVAAIQRSGWEVRLEPLSRSYQFAGSSDTELMSHRIIEWLFPPDDAIAPLGGWRTFLEGQRVVAMGVDDQTMLVSSVATDRILLTSSFMNEGTYYLAAILTLVSMFSVFSMRVIMLPLRRIANAAANADLSNDAQIFEERGAMELVVVAKALNSMRNRISMLMEARTRMLRGISHDLRTPLTRIRMRAESLSEGATRDAILSDIRRLDSLLTESLAYLRDNHRHEAIERTDLASLIQTVCNEFADVDFDVEYQGPNRLVVNCRPLALTRAITNLCDNATKFGNKVLVELLETVNGVVIEVSDDGPGISDQHKDRVFEPFFKADEARNGSNGGFGLGLPIVAEIVQLHNGALHLHDRQPHGLRVRLELPIR